MDEDPIIRFARDFSGNDAELIARVAAFQSEPPTTMEEIGFYGAEENGPRTRFYLGTVNLLGLAGHLQEIEDKYTFEILHRWRDEGLVQPADFPPEADALFGTILDAQRMAAAVASPESQATFRAGIWPIYAVATAQLEAHIAARGRTLLSVDATQGDTLFFALVDEPLAARWRDKALCEEAGYRSGVRSVMWDRFWPHLLASLGLATVEDYSRLPPGVAIRSDAIPFMA